MSFSNIKPAEINENVFSAIGSKWMLVTAGDISDYNTMTASWGGLGVLWNMDVATCYVRPQRYTYEYTEKSSLFTLSFYPEEYRKQLVLCGTKSGRDIDKVAECGFTPKAAENGAVYFEEADLVIVCRKIYYNDLDPDNFLDESIFNNYDGDYHRMYIGAITEVLKKD